MMAGLTTTGVIELPCGHKVARAHLWERMENKLLPGGCATLKLQAFQYELENAVCDDCEAVEKNSREESMDDRQLNNFGDLFKYHAPTEEDIAHYQAINDAAKAFAAAIFAHCPASADRTHAIRVVRDARMWANAAIALKGKV